MNVCWLSLHDDRPARGMWDQALLEELLADAEHAETLEPGGPAIVIVPGAAHEGDETAVTELLAPLPGVVLVVTSDEEHRFDPGAVTHPRIRRWAQYGHPHAKPLPVGPAPHARPHLVGKDPSNRIYDVSFAGQVTHDARRSCVEAINGLSCTTLVAPTEGFAQGLSHGSYMEVLVGSRVVACPRGPVRPDTFRVWEALEAGAVPVVEDGWLPSTVGESPLPSVSAWSELGGVVDEVLGDWSWWAARCQGWWLSKKRALRSQLVSDVEEVSGA